MKTLENGNFDTYSSNNKSLIKSSVFYNGVVYPALKNTGDEKITLKEGYKTTSNGECDTLLVKPNQKIARVKKGNAYDFALYVVTESQVFSSDMIKNYSLIYEDYLNCTNTNSNTVNTSAYPLLKNLLKSVGKNIRIEIGELRALWSDFSDQANKTLS